MWIITETKAQNEKKYTQKIRSGVGVLDLNQKESNGFGNENRDWEFKSKKRRLEPESRVEVGNRRGKAWNVTVDLRFWSRKIADE